MSASGLAAGLSRLALLLLSAIFVVSLIIVGLFAIVLTMLWSLLRGRKPTVFKVYTQFRQASQRFSGGATGFHSPNRATAASDVVDVEAHEVDGGTRLK